MSSSHLATVFAVLFTGIEAKMFPILVRLRYAGERAIESELRLT